ncbi:MAG: hypothetical protein V5A52_01170 [Halovenus sp.]
MELETPADAWYVWVGVAIVSVGVAGVALGVPSQPPPDATEAANAIDRVAVSQYGASASFDHDADAVRIGPKQIALRNDGGTTHASIAVGSMTPVFETKGGLHRAATALVDGEPAPRVVAESSFDSERALREALEDARLRIDREGTNWRAAEGKLRVRAVRLGDETVVLVDA